MTSGPWLELASSLQNWFSRTVWMVVQCQHYGGRLQYPISGCTEQPLMCHSLDNRARKYLILITMLKAMQTLTMQLMLSLWCSSDLFICVSAVRVPVSVVLVVPSSWNSCSCVSLCLTLHEFVSALWEGVGWKFLLLYFACWVFSCLPARLNILVPAFYLPSRNRKLSKS